MHGKEQQRGILKVHRAIAIEINIHRTLFEYDLCICVEEPSKADVGFEREPASRVTWRTSGWWSRGERRFQHRQHQVRILNREADGFRRVLRIRGIIGSVETSKCLVDMHAEKQEGSVHEFGP